MGYWSSGETRSAITAGLILAFLAVSGGCSSGGDKSLDAGTEAEPSIPAGATIWKSANGGNDHGYLLVTAANGITWTDANAAATAAGGYLVTTTTAAENAFVQALVTPVASAWMLFPSSTTYLGPWLGASAEGTTWSWVTLEPWDYTDWESGQPSGTSNGGEVEDKLQWIAIGDPSGSPEIGWNDTTDFAGPSYVIEFE